MKIKIRKITIFIVVAIIVILLSIALTVFFLIKRSDFVIESKEVNGKNTITTEKPIAKTDKNVVRDCQIPAPKNTSVKVKNAGFLYPNLQSVSISEGLVAFRAMIEEVKKWSSDARVIHLYGEPQTFSQVPQGNKERVHIGEQGGSFYSWSIKVYSEIKKQSAYYVYSDSNVSDPTIKDEDGKTIVDYKQFDDITYLADIAISSCRLYEILQKQNVNDVENYLTVRLGDPKDNARYSNRKVWAVEERSRSESSKDPMGDIKYTYYVDSTSGEFLEKKLEN